MQDLTDDVEETLSLSNFLMEDETISPKHVSSSSSLSDQDFLGFFTEEWSGNTSHPNLPENIVYFGKVVSSGPKSQTSPLFRSNSDSFRFMRLKASRRTTTRSKSMPNRPASVPCKSRFMVFMFGPGSSKFPANVDMSDIKSRQLRQQRVDGVKEKNGGRKSGWWRVVDVLGCGGGYERETVGAI